MNQKMHGINLGGWLVLEDWITPSLFKGYDAKDEFTLCLKLGDKARSVLKKHQREFITSKDFKWIASQGFNCVRIPVGYWIFGENPPFIDSIERLAWGIKEAEKYKLGVIIDLHGAPGSQNGWAHSGLEGEINWHKDPQNILKTLDILEYLAKEFGKKPNLYGLELLNEPHFTLPIKLLKEFYLQGYERVRKYCKEDVSIIISDSYRPFEWENFMREPEYKNVILDSHLYQCFGEEDIKLDIKGHLEKVLINWREQIQKMDLPLIIGEWSLALNSQTYENMNTSEIAYTQKSYGAAQLLTFEKALGWFYWTYKTETPGAWNFKDCQKRGILSLH